jgi:hypothetical protein
MSSVQPLPPKKEVALALLERSSVHVHLDPRVTSVIVPSWFKNQPQLVLQVGLNMPVPIPDLRLDDEGMSCTLSFNRAPFHCVVPWESVFAMVGDDGRGMVWPEDLPPEVARQAQARAPQQAPALVPRLQETSPFESADATGANAELVTPPGRPGKKSKKPELREAVAEDPKSKKPRKKPRIVPNPEAENRARLVAVPAPAVSDPRPPRAEPRGHGHGHAPGGGHGAGAGGAGGASRGNKGKRELPPYLRVVK